MKIIKSGYFQSKYFVIFAVAFAVALVFSILIALPVLGTKELLNKDGKFQITRDGNWMASNKINRLYAENNSNTVYLGFTTDSATVIRRLGRYNYTANTTFDLTNRTSVGSFNKLETSGGFAFDYLNNKMYIGGSQFGGTGQLWMYDQTSDALHNLTSIINSQLISSSLNAVAYDPAGKLIYISSSAPSVIFGYYNITSNSSGVLPQNFSNVNSFAYDTAHNILFMGGILGSFAKYNLTTNTTTNLSSALPPGYLSSSLQTVVWAPEWPELVFIGMSNKKLLAYNMTSAITTDYTSYLPNIGAADSIEHIAVDRTYTTGGTSPVIYYGAESSTTKTPKLFLFNLTLNATTNLSGSLMSAGWPTSGADVEDISYDKNAKNLLVAGTTGNLFSYNYTNGITLDLSGTDDAPWHGYATSIYFTMVNASNTAYFVTDGMVSGTEGIMKFGMYNFTSDTVTRLPVPSSVSRGGAGITYIAPDRIIIGGRGTSMLMYNITLNQTFNVGSIFGSAFGFSDIIQAFAYDSAKNLLYFGIDDNAGDSKFGVYNLTSNVTSRLAISTGTSGGVRSLAYDSSRDLVYIAFGGGYLKYYNFTSNSSSTTTNSYFPITGIWSINYDSNKRIVYGTANNGLYWYYNYTNSSLDSFTDLSTTDTGNFTGARSITSATFGQTTNEVYIGGDAVFAVYNATTNITYDYSTNDTNDWVGADRVVSMAYHSPTDTVLVSTTNSRIGILSSVGITPSLVAPTTAANYSATQYATFIYNVSITCGGSSCGNITVYPRADGNAISTTAGATPFFTSSTLLYQCGVLTSGQTCYSSWILNATGPTTSRSTLSTLANSSDASVTSATSTGPIIYYDTDGDGISDDVDNCLTVANANQADWDSDRIGNLCDIYYNATGTAYNPTDRGGNGGSSKTRIHFFINNLGGVALLNSTSGSQINVSVINHDSNNAVQCGRLMPIGMYRIGDELSTADTCAFTAKGNYSLRIFVPTLSSSPFTYRLDTGKIN